VSGLRVTCTAAPGVYLISRDRDVVASVTPERAGAGRELADAMAAAPDLLEAAEAVVTSTYAAHYRLISPFKELVAAIAKAKGGAA